MDQLSETDIVNQLQELNYMVDELVASLSCLLPTHHTLPSITPVDLSFLSFIRKHSIRVENAWVIGVEFCLKNSIFAIVYAHFFEGDNFFGVGSETRRAWLETMLSGLYSMGDFFFFFLETS